MPAAHDREHHHGRGPGARLASRFNRGMERVYDRLRHPAAWTVAAGEGEGEGGDDDGGAVGRRPAGVEGLRGSTYAVLVTYRRTGEPVPSPVWFAVEDGAVVVRTFAGSGKVRRIRHDPRVLIAPSTMRGRPTGPAVPAEARLLPPEAWPRAEAALARAYGLGRRLYEGAAGEQGDALAYLELRPVDGSAAAGDEAGGATPRWHVDAEAYDRWFDRPWGRYASAIERRAIADAVGPVRGVVIDVGCGTGRTSPPVGGVVGVDRDPGMLRLARGRIGSRLVCADADRLPFRDGVAEVGLAVTVCEFAEDPAAVVAELARVTVDGGRVVVGALNRSSPWGLAHRHELTAPPWDRARLLTRAQLLAAASTHGPTTVHSVLFAPDAWPGVRWWGPVLEALGRRLAGRAGAFVVTRTERPPAADPVRPVR